MSDRVSWDQYFCDIAKAVATRATCDRKHVGAVLVSDRRILATGYNGSVAGMPHCDQLGHDLVDGHCVAGSVVVSKFQTGGYNTGHRTIRQIWEQWQHPQKQGAMRRMRIRGVTRTGVIVPDRITNVWRAGRKETVLVSTRLGRSVQVTADHRILTEAGWVPAGELSLSHKVALNGQPLYRDVNWLRSKYLDEGLTQEQIAALSGCGRGTIRRSLEGAGIALREFRLGGWNRGTRRGHSYKGRAVSDSTARSRGRRYGLRSTCQLCETSERLQVHHLDHDPLNDSESNLATLCITCHNTAHTPHAKRESVVFDRVVAIDPAGEDDVFDLTTETTHTFVGNGIVLHNCIRTVHAETNALIQAARNGAATDGATAYVTTYPCWACFKLLANAGVKRVVYVETYSPDPRVADTAARLRVGLVDVANPCGGTWWNRTAGHKGTFACRGTCTRHGCTHADCACRPEDS